MTTSSTLQTAGNIRILLPFKRTERCVRVVRLLETCLPSVPAELHILHVIDPRSNDQEVDVLFDLNQIAREFLPHTDTHIHIERGDPYRTILDRCTRLHVNLLLLPHPTIQHRFFLSLPSSVWFFVKNSPVPTLFIPDPSEGQSSHQSFRSVLIDIDARQLGHPDASIPFALKMARLLAKKVCLSTISRSLNKARLMRSLERLATTYFDSQSRSCLKLMNLRGSFIKTIDTAIKNESPDLLILTSLPSDNPHAYRRYRRIADLIPSLNIPFLICRKNSRLSELESRYHQIYHSLTNVDLAQYSASTDDRRDEDLFHSRVSQQRFLGLYSRQGIEKALMRYGVIHALAQIGYPNVGVEMDTHDPFRQRLRIVVSQPDNQHEIKVPLVDLIVRQQKYPDFAGALPEMPSFSEPYLFVEWICLQDPMRKYRRNQIPLPGQSHPGLGMGWQVLLILKLMARRMGSPGLFNCPEFYHNARFFHRFFHFAAPADEADLLAIDRDTFPIHSVETSWLIVHRLLNRNDARKPFEWKGTPQILPLHPLMHAYFHSDAYLNAVHDHLKTLRFSIDAAAYAGLRESGALFTSP